MSSPCVSAGPLLAAPRTCARNTTKEVRVEASAHPGIPSVKMDKPLNLDWALV